LLDGVDHGVLVVVVEVLHGGLDDAHVPHLEEDQNGSTKLNDKHIESKEKKKLFEGCLTTTYVVQVSLPGVPVDDDGVAAEVVGVAAVERLVDVADEVGQEHQALRRIIWYRA
jgi:hypothetical protein